MNKYAPPQSLVADVAPANPDAQSGASAKPPHAVTIAAWLLFMSVAIGMVKTLYVNGARPHDTKALAVIVIVMAVILGLYLGLILAIRRGRNWARVLFLILTLGGFLMTALSPGRYFPKETLGATVWIIQGIIQAVAACLLFSKPARPWFRRR